MVKLHDLLLPSDVIKDGMTVRDAFRLCLEANVPAIPYVDASGRPTAYISYEGVMHRGCLPNYIVEMASVLGNDLSCVSDAEAKIRQVMESPVTGYLERPLRSLTADALVVKALAILEKFNSSYLFVIDDGHYRGVVTAQQIARRMVEIDAA